jgi:hypothetical protein
VNRNYHINLENMNFGELNELTLPAAACVSPGIFSVF